MKGFDRQNPLSHSESADPAIEPSRREGKDALANIRRERADASQVRLGLPDAQQSSDIDQLTEVMRVVIGNQHGFAKDRLAVSPGNLGKKIGLRIFDQLLHRPKIVVKGVNALVPGGRARRRRAFRPVVIRQRERLVFRVDAELQDVPLRQAHVLDQHPRGMWQAVRDFAAKFGGEFRDDFVESGMGMATIQKLDQIIAKGLVAVHVLS